MFRRSHLTSLSCFCSPSSPSQVDALVQVVQPGDDAASGGGLVGAVSSLRARLGDGPTAAGLTPLNTEKLSAEVAGVRTNLEALTREVAVLRSGGAPALPGSLSIAADVAAVDTRVRLADLAAEITTLKALYDSLSQRLSQKADASEVVVLRQRRVWDSGPLAWRCVCCHL